MRQARRLSSGRFSPLRILHILDHSLPLHSGYTFRTRAIMTAQAAMGLEVAGVTGVRHEAASLGGWSAAAETVDGLSFFRTAALKRSPKLPVLGEIAEVRALARRLDRMVDEWQPDVLHAHSPVLNALATAIVARRRKLPFVYEIRAFWEDAAVGNGTGREGSARYRATRALETFACRLADAIVVICEGLRGDLIARGIPPAKIAVSPNGVDLGLFGDPPPRDDALAQALGLARDADVVGFIGSFYDYEGIDDLIAAMPALVAARPTAELLLVGGGPREGALRAQSTSSPVADRIHFVGRVPHDQVDRYYSLIDVLAYPRKAMRLTELVTPLKPLEAMAQKKLVAASSVGGHRELISDGETGTLFAPDDPQALATALAGLFGDRENWPGRRDRARAFVEKDRNWSLNIKSYLPVYQSVAHHDAASAKLGGLSAVTRTTMKLRPFLLAASKAPIEAPAGALLGASLAFAIFAMPASLFSSIFVAEADGTTRACVAVVAAIALGVATWQLLKIAGKPAPARKAPGEVPTLRRADAHPDAPARAPIFAARDLGTALMDVDVSAPAARVARPAIPQEEPLELTERAPEDATQPNPTITALMDRLKSGLARRAAAGHSDRPAASDPVMRGTLDELSRLAQRRRSA